LKRIVEIQLIVNQTIEKKPTLPRVGITVSSPFQDSRQRDTLVRDRSFNSKLNLIELSWPSLVKGRSGFRRKLNNVERDKSASFGNRSLSRVADQGVLFLGPGSDETSALRY